MKSVLTVYIYICICKSILPWDFVFYVCFSRSRLSLEEFGLRWFQLRFPSHEVSPVATATNLCAIDVSWEPTISTGWWFQT